MSTTARFKKIVEQAGKPRLHVLWGAPASDAEFQRAIKSQRVMTIRQENVGSKKDYGLVGFSQEAPAQFLIFPKSLKAFEGYRVVGINYELFDSSLPAGSAQERTETGRKKNAKSAPLVDQAKLSPEPDLRRRSVEPQIALPKAEPSTGDRVVLPQIQKPAKAETTRAEGPVARLKPAAEFNRRAVLEEVKRAMKELEAGKAVLVFRRLEKLAANLAVKK